MVPGGASASTRSSVIVHGSHGSRAAQPVPSQAERWRRPWRLARARSYRGSRPANNMSKCGELAGGGADVCKCRWRSGHMRGHESTKLAGGGADVHECRWRSGHMRGHGARWWRSRCVQVCGDMLQTMLLRWIHLLDTDFT